MAAIEPVVIKLSDLVDGQEAVCFAALVKKTRGTTQANQPLSNVISAIKGPPSRRLCGTTIVIFGKPTPGPMGRLIV